MPRGKRNDGSAGLAAMQTPEAKEKKLAAFKKNAAKNRVRKLVGRLRELDLAPIDDEIARLRAEIEQLLATREIVSRIKGEKNEQQTVDLKLRIAKILEHMGPMTASGLAANIGNGVSEATVSATLKRFDDGDFIPVENGKWALM